MLRERLACVLEARGDATILLVAEAAGYRGARVTGIPFTSERQLTGAGPAEATATIVHRTLAELGLERRRAALERRPDAPAPARASRLEPPADAGARSPPRPFCDELGARPPRDRGRAGLRMSGHSAGAVRPPPLARRRAGGSASGLAIARALIDARVRRNTVLLAATLDCLSGMLQLARALATMTLVLVTGIEGILGLGPGDLPDRRRARGRARRAG